MDSWPERGNDCPALPKSMPETARLSVFEKESGSWIRGIGAPWRACFRIGVYARFDSHEESKRAFCMP